MKLDYFLTKPSAHTFTIKPVKRVLYEVSGGNWKGWLDPFAGNNSPAEFTNDINPGTFAKKHLDALEFLKEFDPGFAEGVLLDPPYTSYQLKTVYENFGKSLTCKNSNRYWASIKNEIHRILKPDGVVISFGYNSVGMGQRRFYRKERVITLCFGGHHYDVQVVVDRKLVNNQLQFDFAA